MSQVGIEHEKEMEGKHKERQDKGDKPGTIALLNVKTKRRWCTDETVEPMINHNEYMSLLSKPVVVSHCFNLCLQECWTDSPSWSLSSCCRNFILCWVPWWGTRCPLLWWWRTGSRVCFFFFSVDLFLFLFYFMAHFHSPREQVIKTSLCLTMVHKLATIICADACWGCLYPLLLWRQRSYRYWCRKKAKLPKYSSRWWEMCWEKRHETFKWHSVSKWRLNLGSECFSPPPHSFV